MSFNFNNGTFGQPKPQFQYPQQMPQQIPQQITQQPQVADAKQIYKQLGAEFCKNYYTAYDTNYQSLVYMFKPESIFTFLDDEIVGFNNVYTKVINHYGIQKFTHEIKTIDSQPVGSKTILISVFGLVRVNDHITPTNPFQPFSELFFLQRDDATQSYYVYNNIFKLLHN